jgi:TonB family protein
MHELERQALDDPFLQDALEGYEHSSKNQQENINELTKRLQHRINPVKKRLTLWPAMGVAASVLVFIALGSWWLISNRGQVDVKNKPVNDNTLVNVRPLAPAAKVSPKQDAAVLQPNSNTQLRPAGAPNTNRLPQVRLKYKTNDLIAEAEVPVARSNSDTISYAPRLSLVAESRANGVATTPADVSGSDKGIRIRGASTITSKDPLYIIDGKVYEGDASNINPNNVGDVSVIRDVAATALYGSRAANGVILITTKKGKKSLSDSNLMAQNRLNEVTIGYGTQHKKEITGSVTPVTPTPIEQTLQGRVAGVQVGRGRKQKPADTLRTITGKVLAKSDGQPLPGVSVRVAGKNTGAQTDINGKFKIEVSANDELSVQYIGYLTKSLRVKGKDSLRVDLEESNSALSDVVVVGYGTTRKQPKDAHPVNGWGAFNKYLEKEAAAAGITGTVRLSFTVNPDKTLNDFKIIKSLNPNADQQAIDIIKNGPKWVPNVNGKPETVKVRIHFKE